MVQLRGWQQEAFDQYLERLNDPSLKRSALWEATPGAGKTAVALRVIQHQLKNKLARSALVVVPTSHLRIQWSRAAVRDGIHLDSSFGGNRSVTSDFNGVVVTYQQLANREQWFKEYASKSVVILDEVHHSGDGLSWGNTLRTILQHAPFILCLSGTAFRSDSNPIPFVTYDRMGVSQPDYTYSYAEAVKDSVCRPTAFFTYGGDVSWQEQDRILSANFSDPLDRMTSGRRLRAALEAESGWIQPMIKDAHDMLTMIRSDHHPQAGALMVCADQTHARGMAKLITAVTGERPTVVLSDDADASRKIKNFADSSSSWLIACNMVSEGVDIPRLRIGVYATTIRTKMYFRQFLGRIVRRQSTVSGLQVAYFYLPADPILRQMAEEIESEIQHSLKNDKDSFFDDEGEERKEKDPERTKQWSALSSVNSGLDAVILHGNQLFLFDEMRPAMQVKEIIDQEIGTHLHEALTHSEIKNGLAAEIKRLVGVVSRKRNVPHSGIHTILNKSQGIRSQTHCTEAQLRTRIELLEQMLLSGNATGSTMIRTPARR